MRLAHLVAASCLLVVLVQPATACIALPAPHRISVVDVTTGTEQELPRIALGGVCGFDPPPFAMEDGRVVWLAHDGAIMVHDLVAGTTRSVEPVAEPGGVVVRSIGRNHGMYGPSGGDLSLSGDVVYLLGVTNTVIRVSLESGERATVAWPFATFNGTFALAGPLLWAAELGSDGYHRYVHAYDLDVGKMLLQRFEVTASDGVYDYENWYPEAFLETGIVVMPPGVEYPTHAYLELVDGHLNAYRFASPFLGDAQDGSTFLYGVDTEVSLPRRDLLRWNIPPTGAEAITIPPELGTLGPLLAAHGDQVVVFLWNATAADIGPEPTPAPPAGSGLANPLPASPALLLVAVVAVLAAWRRRNQS